MKNWQTEKDQGERDMLSAKRWGKGMNNQTKEKQYYMKQLYRTFPCLLSSLLLLLVICCCCYFLGCGLFGSAAESRAAQPLIDF